MRVHSYIILAFVILLMPAGLPAQQTNSKYGIFAVEGDKTIPLAYTIGSGYYTAEGFRLGDSEIGHELYRYDNVPSGVNTTTDTFLLVLDGSRSGRWQKKLNKFEFGRKLTPGKMMLIHFTPNPESHFLEFSPGSNIDGIKFESCDEVPFEFEKTVRHTYKIKVPDLPAGEYAFTFRPSRLISNDYTRVFRFTVPQR